MKTETNILKNEYIMNKLYLLQEYKLVRYLKTYYINRDLKKLKGKLSGNNLLKFNTQFLAN